MINTSSLCHPPFPFQISWLDAGPRTPTSDWIGASQSGAGVPNATEMANRGGQ